MTSIPTENETRVLVFKYICNFIKDLNESFGEKQKSLLLYAHLMDKTGIMHEEPIKKHVQLFYSFVKANEEPITNKDLNHLIEKKIFYSEKVGIDLDEILTIADQDEKDAICKHLLTLLAILDPSSSAKKVLKDEIDKKAKRGEKGNEEMFLKNVIDKVSSEMDGNVENPMQLMNKMMTSGVFTEVVENMNSSLNDGSLDMGKMIGTMQMLMGNIGSMMNNMNGEGGENALQLPPKF
jgi:hypothetical protein